MHFPVSSHLHRLQLNLNSTARAVSKTPVLSLPFSNIFVGLKLNSVSNINLYHSLTLKFYIPQPGKPSNPHSLLNVQSNRATRSFEDIVALQFDPSQINKQIIYSSRSCNLQHSTSATSSAFTVSIICHSDSLFFLYPLPVSITLNSNTCVFDQSFLPSSVFTNFCQFSGLLTYSLRFSSHCCFHYWHSSLPHSFMPVSANIVSLSDRICTQACEL